jgi:hypothetical protein
MQSLILIMSENCCIGDSQLIFCEKLKNLSLHQRVPFLRPSLDLNLFNIFKDSIQSTYNYIEVITNHRKTTKIYVREITLPPFVPSPTVA